MLRKMIAVLVFFVLLLSHISGINALESDDNGYTGDIPEETQKNQPESDPENPEAIEEEITEADSDPYPEEAAEVISDEYEEQEISESYAENSEEVSSTDGNAYAVFTDARDLVFFRSNQTYSNNTQGTAEDIYGNTYSGTIYANIENLRVSTEYSIPWRENRADVLSVRVADGQQIRPVSLSYWFYNFTNMTNADLNGLDTGNVTGMMYLFYSCKNLTAIDLSGFDTSNTTDLRGMFSGCSSLSELDLSGFDTGKAVYMYSLFNGCSNLSVLNLGNINTASVKDMSSMFKGCSSLSVLNLENINTSSVNDMSSMFSGCNSLNELDLSGFDTGKTTNMESMFDDCTSLTKIDLSNFDTSNVTSMASMFQGCSNLSSLDLGSFNTEKVIYMYKMFRDCSSLSDINVSSFNAENVAEMFDMFYGCSSLSSLDLSSFRTSSVTSLGQLFYGCTNLVDLDISNLSTGKVSDPLNMAFLFKGCDSLIKVNMSPYFTKWIGASYLPEGLWTNEKLNKTLTSLELYNQYPSNAAEYAGIWVTRSDHSYAVLTESGELIFFRSEDKYSNSTEATVTDINGKTYTGRVFKGPEEDTGISYRPWNQYLKDIITSYVAENQTLSPRSMKMLFSGCTNLKSVDLRGFDTSNTTDISSLFKNCNNLLDVDLSTIDTSAVTTMSMMFDGCSNLTDIDLSRFNTNNVTDMSSMFYDCRSLTQLDISSFSTNKIDNMAKMFENCTGLKTIKLGNHFSNWGSEAYFPEGQWKHRTDGKLLSETELYKQYINSPNYMSGYWDYNGKAYAVQTDDNELIFFRSMNPNQYGQNTITDIEGNTYTGKIYSGIEKMDGNPGWTNNITSVKVANNQVIMPVKMYEWFTNCTHLTSVDLKGINTNYTTSFYRLFAACHSLTELDLSSWYTPVAVNMNQMFYYMGSLRSLDISKFVTGNVTDMSNMFSDSNCLEKIKLGSGFNKWINNSYLPVGKWTNDSTGKTLSSADLYAQYPVNASAWAGTWTKQNELYAILTNQDEMIFFNSTRTYRNLETANNTEINGNTYSGKIYRDFENLNCESAEELPWNQARGSIKTVSAADNLIFNPAFMSHWFENCTKLTTVDLHNISTFTTNGVAYMFSGCTSLVSVDFNGFSTSKDADMSFMFNDCNALTELDLNGIDTSNVVSMNSMFNNCAKLTNLNLGNFDTSKVTDMSSMFNDCNTLTELELSDFDTSSAVNMNSMFSNCAKLASLNLGNFDTSKVTDMSSMFNGCNALTELDLSGFNTSNAVNMNSMFSNCTKLASLNLDNFDTSKVTDMSSMFNDCNALAELKLTNFITSKVQGMASMFAGCSSLSSLDISSFSTASVITMDNMFSGMSSLKEVCLGKEFIRWISGTLPAGIWTNTAINLSLTETELLNKYPSNATKYAGTWQRLDRAYAVLDEKGELIFFRSNSIYTNKSTGSFVDIQNNQYNGTLFADFESLRTYEQLNKIPWFSLRNSIKKVRGVSGQQIIPLELCYWFASCENLTEADLSTFDTDNVIRMSYMFRDCTNLVSVDFSGCNTINVTDMSSMFSGCSSLAELDLSGFDTSNTEKMRGMFNGCTNLTSLNLGNFNTLKATDMSSMFSGCSSLAELDLSGFDTSNTEKMNMMFYGCTNLTSLNLSKFNTSKVTEMSSMFSGCSSLAEVNLTGFNTSNTEDMSSMFDDCAKLTSLNLSSFDTSKVMYMSRLFNGCSSLTSLDLSGFDTQNVNTMDYMFENCSNLTSLDLSNFKTSKVTRMDYMFHNCRSLLNLDIGSFDTRNIEDIIYIGSPYRGSHIDYMLVGCDNLKAITLGANFQKNLLRFGLRKGMWKNERLGLTLNESQLCINYPSNAGEWAGTWVLTEIPGVPTRISGTDRYSTSIKAAEEFKEWIRVSKFDTVILANGQDYPDALAGSYLAYVKNAPILLTDKMNQNTYDKVNAYIKENLKIGGTVYVLGGTGAVSDESIRELNQEFIIRRLAGKNRYETNIAILNEAEVTNEDIIVCTGTGYADSLSASSAKKPILLVDPSGLTGSQKNYLEGLKKYNNKYYIIGGTGAVTTETENSIAAYGSVERVAGRDRFTTSTAMADKFYPDTKAAVLAYSHNFPDGLCGGPLATAINAPIILTQTGSESAAADWCRRHNIKTGYVLGGTRLISDESVKIIFDLQ